MGAPPNEDRAPGQAGRAAGQEGLAPGQHEQESYTGSMKEKEKKEEASRRDPTLTRTLFGGNHWKKTRGRE